LDPTTRFSNRVTDYARYRPGYPREIVPLLQRECGLQPDSAIADLGCGTGLLAKLFCENGNRVFGIEPNAPMREAGAEFLRGYPGFSAVDGRAEATALPAASVDFITAGEAFHWFQPAETRREALRILRPGGWVMVAFNDRRYGPEPFLVGYEELLLKHSVDYPQIKARWDNLKLEEFFCDMPCKTASFPNQQSFDCEGLIGRMFSASYMPQRGHPQYKATLSDTRELFDRYQKQGLVQILYDTNLYYGRLAPEA